MTYTNAIAGPGAGINLFKQEERYVLNKTGLTTIVGQLVQFDIGLTVATTYVEGSINATTGLPNSAYNVVVTPALSGAATGPGNLVLYAWMGIALEAVADGKMMKVCLRGRCQAMVRAITSGGVRVGNGTVLSPASNATNTCRFLVNTYNVNNVKKLGYVEGTYASSVSDVLDTAEASYTAGVLVLWPIIFNGIEGIG